MGERERERSSQIFKFNVNDLWEIIQFSNFLTIIDLLFNFVDFSLIWTDNGRNPD